ncbi:MAG: FkbM family methyltransferase [Prolixibacteraceae bacterium]|nr:FkbM family methyltransferase [Prolixibacteraceae bacterium]
MRFIKKNLNQGDTVFDIGAHKGGYLNFIRKCVGEQGMVVGFEPQLNLYMYLNSMKKSFRWTNVKIEHLALSAEQGISKLYIPANNTRIGSSPEATLLEFSSKKEIYRIENVKTQTIDNYVKLHGIKPVFLKIDVEGNELNVFKGGQKLLSTVKPKIIVEIEARHAGKERVIETFKFLDDLNYSGKFIYKNKLIDLNKFTFDQYQNTMNMDSYCNNFIFE